MRAGEGGTWLSCRFGRDTPWRWASLWEPPAASLAAFPRQSNGRQTMKSRGTYVAAALLAVLIPLAQAIPSFLPSPLPKANPYMGQLPSAVPPGEMAVFALVTGVNHRIAAY